MPEEELSDFENEADPLQLKKWRTSSKSTHSKSLTRLSKAINSSDTAENVKLARAIVVRDFEELERRHARYLLAANLTEKDQEKEDNWLDEIIERHRGALRATDDYLEAHPSSEKSARSARTSSSSQSANAYALVQKRLEARKLELELQQMKQEKVQELVEKHRLHELEAQRKMEERRVALERK